MAERKFHCDACGANVEFSTATEHLECTYCGATKQIPKNEAEVREHDLGAALERGFSEAPTLEARTVDCGACGAVTRFEAEITAARCAFCDAPVVLSAGPDRRVLAPQAVLPFGVDAKTAKASFRAWLSSRWFAPSDLGRRARDEGLDGVYLPYFTFDANTESFYRGQRGDHYFVTETYEAVENGRRVRKSRQVRHTAWSHRSGVVWVNFDDVLVLASRGLPASLANKLEPWDLEALVPYNESYLSGYQAECDQLGLAAGFEACKARCEAPIRREIERDIGGDEQRVASVETAWTDVTFKHALLPVWIGAFRYGDKVYRVAVNARTGETQGERPWSAVKIAAAVLAAALLALVIYWLVNMVDGGSMTAFPGLYPGSLTDPEPIGRGPAGWNSC